MVRMQVQLTEDQHLRLRRWARDRRVSMSEAVRRCVAAQIVEEPVRSREQVLRAALEVCGKYAERTPRSRVARDHDAHLVEAYR